MARPREFDIDEALGDAMAAFWAHGYVGTSMTDLTEATGLKKGSIYKAWEDKHDLFVQSLRRYLDAVWISVREAIQDADSPKAGIRSWLQGQILPTCAASPACGCFAVNSQVELSSHDAEVGALLESHFQRVGKLLTTAILRGQELGEFRTDRSARDLAELLVTHVLGVVSMSKRPQSLARTKRLIDLILQDLNK